MFILIAEPQKSIISGHVKDSISGEGLPFDTVQLMNALDSTLLKGVIADESGSFQIENIEQGEYILVASYMGYYHQSLNLSISSRRIDYQFRLSPKNLMLWETNISAEKSLIEKTIEKTTVNISKNTTLSGGTAIDVMQSLPSVDVDIDGNVHYRGSDKVVILVNGEKSELVKSLEQIAADQIEKVEIINNPSAKYDAEGMSGIINIILKSGKNRGNKLSMRIYAGYPETAGGNIGYASNSSQSHFYINGGLNHKTKFQTKEHLRRNYENPYAENYYQYDGQDANLNDAFVFSSFDHAFSKKQKVSLSLMGSKKFNNADRSIKYRTQNESEFILHESMKELDISLDNYVIDGSLKYRYNFRKRRHFKSRIHYSYLDQMLKMNNRLTAFPDNGSEELQNTFSKQLNKGMDVSLDYNHPFNDSARLESGYQYMMKDLLNDFSSESSLSNEWTSDTSLANTFNYIQEIHALYVNIWVQLKYFELQAGLRSEYTTGQQNDIDTEEYFDLFPSVSLSKKLNKKITLFAAYNRRKNRPTIKMLNPYTDEYADLLNMHRGNPGLKPEYVNFFEIGSRFVFKNLSGLGAVYYRDIGQAISRVKSASNDSALYVTFINLDEARMIGAELSLNYRATRWWNINSNANLFHTNLSGYYANNAINNNRTGWNLSLSNSLKLPWQLSLQFTAFYKSALPSVMGTYMHRYYADAAISRNFMNKKAWLIFKVSDVFNTYRYGLDLDALDENGFRYSQRNRRKNESQYFILSFVYNINGKENGKKKKLNFFLEEFDK